MENKSVDEKRVRLLNTDDTRGLCSGRILGVTTLRHSWVVSVCTCGFNLNTTDLG